MIKLIDNKKSYGASFIEVVFIVFILIVGVYFALPYIGEAKDNVEEKYAETMLEKAYSTIDRLNIETPDYAYTDVSDNSKFIKDMLVYIRANPYDAKTDKGVKIIFRKDRNKNIIIWYEFKDARRMRIVNGQIDPKFYTPPTEFAKDPNYGEAWLFRGK